MNLQDRDNLRTKDKRPVPKVSFVRRLDCIYFNKIKAKLGGGGDNHLS